MTPSRANQNGNASERTPLVTHVPVAPYRRAHRSNTCTRFVYLVARVFIFYGLLYLIILLPLSLLPSIHNPFSSGPAPHKRFPLPSNKELPLKKLLKILDDTANVDAARKWSKYYTSGTRLAGKNYTQAVWTRDKWREFGIKAEIEEYEVLLNYPVSHRLAMVVQERKGEEKVVFEARLEEDELEEDEASRWEDRVPTFHGYSANGNITAPYVYGGMCTFADFAKLDELNISVKDHIVLCRYGSIFRGLKVKGAQDRGAVGVIIFTDPADDHPASWGGGGNGTTKTPYPKGDSRQPSSVQRGSVNFLSVLPGDPTTPGYASKPGVPREDPSFAIPSIPSLPISYVDAIPILKSLNGWGAKPKGWEGDLKGEGVDYWTGPIGKRSEMRPTVTNADAPSKTLLHLINEVTFTTTPIWDVIGVINGSISDEIVVIGNHRDAWDAGAADPGSGSTALMELVRSYGVMLKKGWTPLRTVVIASWDGEEYGLVGSTEWVEDHRSYLMQNAVAYLNLDVATSGSEIGVAGAPLLNKVLLNALQSVEDPLADHKRKERDENGMEEIEVMPVNEGMLVADYERKKKKKKHDNSIYEFWHSKIIRTIGSGSDFTAFQDMAMIPSLDFSFKQSKDGAVYHYHSNYDSFHWMEKFGDPGFLYHVAATKILGTVSLSLIEAPVLPFNLTDYALALEAYTKQVVDQFDHAKFQTIVDLDANTKDSIKQAKESLSRLKDQVSKLTEKTNEFDENAALLSVEVDLLGSIPWWKWWKKTEYWQKIKDYNSKIMYFERKFAYEDGLDGRPVFKHVVYAPGLWTGYAGAVFPGIVESIETSNYTNIERWSEIIQKCVIEAAASLD